MKELFKCALIVCFLSFVNVLSAFSQNPDINVLLDTNNILIGKQTGLKYVVTKDDDEQIIFPAFIDTLNGDIEIVGDVVIDSNIIEGGKEVVEQKLVITSFEEGLQYIPKQAFILKNNSSVDTFYSNDTYLNVQGVEIDTSGVIRDIKDVEWIAPTFSDFLPFIIVLFGLFIIAGIIAYLIKRPKDKPIIHFRKPLEPAHVIALRELDKLKAQKLWQQEHLKDYYSRLTAIVRKYLEQQFAIKAMEESTNEILSDISNKNLNKYLDNTLLTEILNLADLIKFAKGHASPQENIAHLENAYELVKSSYKKIHQEQEAINATSVAEKEDNSKQNIKN